MSGDSSPTAVLLGVDGFAVLAAAEVGGEVELLVETTATLVGCPDCGVVAVAKDRRAVTVRDLPVGGRPVVLVWHNRVWACPEPRCSQRSWTQTSPAVRPRAALTERVREWAFAEVGRKGRSTAEVARELGVGWATVGRTVAAKGRPVVDDPARLDGVEGLGVEETAFLSAPPSSSPTTYVTGIVDVTCGRASRLLDVVPGRSGRVYADWLAEREPAWRAQITFAALDPFRGVSGCLRGSGQPGRYPCCPAASPWLSVPLAPPGCLLADLPGASLGGGIGAGLKGACPAEPSNAVPIPLSRPGSDSGPEGVSVGQGIAGVDPHKTSVTMAVVDLAGAELSAASFDNTGDGLQAAVVWLAGLGLEIVRVGVEGSAGHGRHLAERLVAAGYDTREVPPRRTAERRRARRRAKTDREDALAIARATAGEPNLGPVKAGAGLGAAHDELVVVRAHRELLVQRRTMMLNHAEAALCGLPRQVADSLPPGRAVAPRLLAATQLDLSRAAPAVRAALGLLTELRVDIAEISERIKTLEKRLAQLITTCGSTLTEEPGIGVVGAATLLAEIGDPARFRSESAFNRWWGGAPVAISSGEGHNQPIRHRLDLFGNRSVNCVLHMMSVTQARYHQPARNYLARKRVEGHSTREARRTHKTQLGRRVIRRMWTDRQRAMRAERDWAAATPTAA